MLGDIPLKVIDLPPALIPVLEALRRVGRPRLVGGCVRDQLLNLTPGDIDIEVADTDFDQLHAALRPFGSTDVVGRSFGVIKLRRHDVEYDFALPRRESKTGRGHRGFKVQPDPSLSDTEAAARRDFTINAMAWDPFSQQLIDPHHGQQDLAAKRLRHTSEAFVEDPLRVLRAMQLAARFDFTLAPETAALGQTMVPEAASLSLSRIWGEWDKWCLLSAKPARGLEVLAQSGWINHFPELASLVGTPQEPEWHPEGDVFVHTGHCLNALISTENWFNAPPDRRRILMLAVLAHDFGKPATTSRIEKRGQLRWTSPGHAVAGLPLTESFLQRIGAPLRLTAPILPLVQHHLAHVGSPHDTFSDTQVRRLSRKLAPASINDLAEVMKADARGRPPIDPEPTLTLIDRLARHADSLALQDSAPRPLIQGRHLVSRSLKPGPSFTPIITTAYEAQLDGAFFDENTSLNWLDRYLKSAKP
ncbi:MAG: HD domain-containing protein [Candidatus Synoicihabitans palmerolidicus]|nr:HD domain-containing protein [Candidatus Synoicihabitans palmerolidicus]